MCRFMDARNLPFFIFHPSLFIRHSSFVTRHSSLFYPFFTFVATNAKNVHFRNFYTAQRTDAFDTLYIGCEKFPQHDTYNYSGGGVM